MTGLLPPWPLLAGFLVASLALAVTPGPGVLFIVARSIVQGRRSGLVSVAGVALGNLGCALAAALGLAALLAVSSTAFEILKYAGATYLIFLGVQMLRTARRGAAPQSVRVGVPDARVFRDGLLVALFNPKTMIFFAAFLPQFLATPTPSAIQIAALGALFVLIAAATDTVYAVLAGAAAPLLSRSEGLQRTSAYIGASTFIGLGLLAALTGLRTNK